MKTETQNSKPAPAVFVAMWNSVPAGMKPFPIFNLTADVAGHCTHSTVSAETLIALGFDRPAGYKGVWA